MSAAIVRRCAFALILATVPLHAQTAPPAGSGGEAARQLAFLLGEWEGDGWIVLGPSGRRNFHQKETVRTAAGGAVVVIDGSGTSTDPGRTGEIVHQAFAVVSYDSASAALRWRAYRAGSGEIVDTPVVRGDTLTWGMDLGPSGRAGRVRFTILRTSAGEWNEIGELLAPDPAASPRKFFEMTLRRR